VACLIFIFFQSTETDKLFDGNSAFPQSATLVTGLKYKSKYRGYTPEKSWPIHLEYDKYGNKNK
jgi:hypothetical protein